MPLGLLQGQRSNEKRKGCSFRMYLRRNIVLHKIIKMFGGFSEKNISRTEISLSSFSLEAIQTKMHDFFFMFNLYIY